MTPHTSINQARKAVSKDEIEQAIEEIQPCVDYIKRKLGSTIVAPIRASFLTIQSRYSRIKKEKINGTSQDNTRMNEINMSFLELIDEIEELLTNQNTSEPHIDSNAANFTDTTVAVETETEEIEITIDRDFKSYSENDQEKLLSALASLLDLERAEIKIKKKRKGSVKLTLSLPKGKAKELLDLIETGKLSEFDVKEIGEKILKDTPIFGSYENFLQAFLNHGYQFVSFKERDQPINQVILRHDVDFDTNFALQIAQIESTLGIKSTYFFLLRSDLYNILSPKTFDQIRAIKALGHSISIHFDPLIYEDFYEGLAKEIEVFQHLFDEKIDIISLHRPHDYFKTYDAPIQGVEHTYQSKYLKDVKYFSDSTGKWRYGHPFDSDSFLRKESLHILIHPIWWAVNGKNSIEKLRLFFELRIEEMKKNWEYRLWQGKRNQK